MTRVRPTGIYARRPSTINTPAFTANFGGAIRIVPGKPDDSLIMQLASTRGSSRAMPPIASRVIDVDGTQALRHWIERLAPAGTGGDGGTAADAGADAAGLR